MRDLLTRLSKARFPYEPLITIDISKRDIIGNLKEFAKIAPEWQIAPVLKSNAYGHSLIEIARILSHEKGLKIPFFVVDSYFEAITLRVNNIRTPIVIIGYTAPETIDCARLLNTAFTITSLDSLRSLTRIKKNPDWSKELDLGRIIFGIPFLPHNCHIHLKIDTGMHRQGILPEEIPEAIEMMKGDSMVSLEGICSHLSDADDNDESNSESQINIWNRVVKQFKESFPNIKYFHLSNTDGHRFQNDISANVSRLGIGLYGLIEGSTWKPVLNTKPVLEMKTIITGIKRIKSGDTVGYNNTFKAMKDMTIATIPVGYYEGVDRRLSNCGTVLVGHKRISVPIIGRVSMNISTIDVSNVPNVKIGDPVVVFSRNNNESNSIIKIAKRCHTIPYEIVTGIPAHLKRIVVDNE